MLKTKKTKKNLDTIEEDLNYVRGLVDHLYTKIDTGMVTNEELKIVKFFIYIITILLCIFELISVILILTQ